MVSTTFTQLNNLVRILQGSDLTWMRPYRIPSTCSGKQSVSFLRNGAISSAFCSLITADAF